MICVFADRQGGRYRLLVEGHAEHHADAASICAAVSVLTQSLVRFACDAPDCRHLRWSVERGRVFLSCRAGLGNAFEMVLGGLAELADTYPECVRVIRTGDPPLTTSARKYATIKHDASNTRIGTRTRGFA